MIRVERDQLDDNGKPIRPSEAWFQRASTATAKALEEGAEHEVTALNRDDDLRMALEGLFRRKCAYCESRVGTESPGEVEHYRPHGAVAERPDHAGYYWLAYTWTNLYWACTYCNQRRRDRPTWQEPVTDPPAGKWTSFPLADESERAMSPDADLDRERPLLLAPDAPGVDPEERFRYDVHGQIHPRDPEDAQADQTILICNLQRRRLRLERARIIKRISRLYHRLAEHRLDDRSTVELQEQLDEWIRDDALYAGAARDVLRDPGAFTGSLLGPPLT